MRPVIELVADADQVLGREGEKVDSLRKVVTQETIRVYVARPLTRAFGVAVEHRHVNSLGDCVVVTHFAALVPGQRPARR